VAFRRWQESRITQATAASLAELLALHGRVWLFCWHFFTWDGEAVRQKRRSDFGGLVGGSRRWTSSKTWDVAVHRFRYAAFQPCCWRTATRGRLAPVMFYPAIIKSTGMTLVLLLSSLTMVLGVGL
jgi:hypothetical protein